MHNGDIQLPFYERGVKEYTVEELVSILFCDSDDPRVCTAQPTRVKQSCCFVVDVKCVSDINDLRADDCGVWTHKGVRKSYTVVNDTSKEVVFYTREKAPPSEDLLDNHSLYLLTRVYHDLQASPHFKRMIATLTSW